MHPAHSALESLGTSRLLSIGELAERAGVATTALRYHDQLGLVRPATRESGRRRYAASAVAQVGVILFFREIGFSLAEIDALLAAGEQRSRQQIVERKPIHQGARAPPVDSDQGRRDGLGVGGVRAVGVGTACRAPAARAASETRP